MKPLRLLLAALLLWTLPLTALIRWAFPAPEVSADWPMWRYNAARGNATPHELPRDLHLHWVRQLPAAQTAWPTSQTKLQFDAAPQPIVLGKRIFVPSTAYDSLTAYDTETGKELWRFYAEGPIRFAPVGYKDSVYFVSDDGHLYCLDVEDGELKWKVNGGPSERWLLGNHRLISMWPARGGPVLHQGKIYFTASIWPFMGIFIHAVDPDTGAIVWTNSGDGANFNIHPHGAAAFGSVSPQGHLAASGDSLIVPGGRSLPAVYDIHDGELRHFKFDNRVGNHEVMAGKQVYFVDGRAYHLSDGEALGSSNPALLNGQVLYSFGKGDTLKGETIQKVKQTTKTDRKGKKTKISEMELEEEFDLQLKKSAGKVAIKAGQRIYTGGKGKVTAFDLGDDPSGEDSLVPVWSASIEGEVHHMLAADHRLFVMTTDCRLYCFGEKELEAKTYSHTVTPLGKKNDDWTGKVSLLVPKLEFGNQKEAAEGYCLALGIGSGRLLEELLQQSKLYVVVLDPDADRVNDYRRKLEKAGQYGKRIEIKVADPGKALLPPYFANLIVCEEPDEFGLLQEETLVKKLFESLRPYGGRMCLELSGTRHVQFAEVVKHINSKQAVLKRKNEITSLVREGPLPGAGEWTHQYADAGQTGVSRDKLVKAPLGLLWFGGPSNDEILPRHGHGPSPQVAGGRLFIEGPDMLRAMDIYTGRVLWEKKLKDFGKYYNTTKHFPGAGEIGSNYVSLADKVYAVYGHAVLELDAATGNLTKEFKLQVEDGKEPPHWGFIAVWEDLLIATSSPVPVKLTPPPKDKKDDKTKSKGEKGKGDADDKKDTKGPCDEAEPDSPGLPTGPYGSGSKRLVVFNRQSGKLLWSKDAEFTFRHNNIAIGAGKIFCIDNITQEKKQELDRKGIKFQGEPTLYALEARTGKVAWSTRENVFGTFLNYSPDHDLLLQAGSKYRDRAADEVGKGMSAFRGKDGKVLWNDPKITYGGPCLLWKDKILTNGLGGFAIDMKTGKPTGWKYSRMYGCNTAFGSENLLTFRSGCAGFFDLENDAGTGNLGGFRSSCTNNLIVADGILSAPDYTRTCTCAYQNQTSLALIHMPEAEYWTFGATAKANQMGLNFGAPGDRRAPNGTLWQAKGKWKTEPAKPEVFRLHSSLVQGKEPKWVAASGFEGVESITLDVKPGKKYQVKLHFLEPENLKPGQRIFDVTLQGKTVLADFDIVAAAGKAQTAAVREFIIDTGINQLRIELHPQGKMPAVISGVELIEK